MQHNNSYVGPRGWALLTLVGGAALASLFVRPPQAEEPAAAAKVPAAQPEGLARLASMDLSTAHSNGLSRLTNERSLYELSELSQQIVPPAAAAPSELPAWAPVHSPIDQLISQGTAPPWQPDSESQSALKPLTPWINDLANDKPLAALPSPPAAVAQRAWPEASSVPVADRHRSALSEPPRLGNIAPASSSSSGSSSSSSSSGSLTGSLAGTSHTMRAATTPRLQPPEASNAAPARRHFVYQPGFNASAP